MTPNELRDLRLVAALMRAYWACVDVGPLLLEIDRVDTARLGSAAEILRQLIAAHRPNGLTRVERN